MEDIPDKLAGFQLVKKYPTFCGTWRFITAFTSVRHLSLSWARSIQSMLSYPTSLRSSLMISSHLHTGFPNVLFPSGLPTKCSVSIRSPHQMFCFHEVSPPNVLFPWGLPTKCSVSMRSPHQMFCFHEVSPPNVLFPWGLLTKTLSARLLSPVHATCTSHLILQTYIIIAEGPWIVCENGTLYFHWSFIFEYYINVNEKGPMLLKGIFYVVDLSQVFSWPCVTFSCYLPSNVLQGWPCSLNLNGLVRKRYNNRAFAWRDLGKPGHLSRNVSCVSCKRLW